MSRWSRRPPSIMDDDDDPVGCLWPVAIILVAVALFWFNWGVTSGR